MRVQNRIRTTGIITFLAMMIPGIGFGATGDETVARGNYIFRVAGCIGCHTTEADRKKNTFLAGGRALKTPFGTYYSPNITPDPKFGIGNWREHDFVRALRQGKNPDGRHYFPVFPYTSYTQMTDQDMRDLWAFLKTQPPVPRKNKDHDVGILFGARIIIGAWKILNFSPGVVAQDSAKSGNWNRGRYLVNALGHCGECHTPRDHLGGTKTEMYLSGTSNGPDGDTVPNITPDKETGINTWTNDDYDSLLSMGMLPDGDFVGGSMGEVVDNLEKLTEADRNAIVVYLKSIPAIFHKIEKSPAKQ